MSDRAIRLPGEPLTCLACGDEIEEGYAAGVEQDGEYALRSDDAICGRCGFTEIGFAGCAPTLADLDADAAVLVRFTLDGNSLDTTQITDTAE